MSSSSSSSSMPPSLSSLFSTVAPAPSVFVQSDWHAVLREFNTARTTGGGRAAVERLGKESRQFWMSRQRMGEEGVEAIVQLEEKKGEEVNASSSLIQAARSVQARVVVEGAKSEEESGSSEFEVRFNNPLQLVARYTPSSLTQLIQAPRSTLSTLHPSGDIFTVDVCPAGSLAISGAVEGNLRTWDPNTGALVRDLKGHKGDVTLARFFPSGSVALSTGLDLSLKIWALDSGLVAASLSGHGRPITQVRIVERGRHLLSASEDGSAKLWDVSQQAPLATYADGGGNLSSTLKFNDAILIDPSSHSTPVKGRNESVEYGAAVDVPEPIQGSLLLTAGSDGLVRAFDLRARSQVFMLPTGASSGCGGVERLLPGPLPYSFVLGTGEGHLAVVDLRTRAATYAMRQDDASITNLRPWGEDSFWSTNSTGATNLWQLTSSSSSSAVGGGSIVAQLSGIDCEPVHDLCLHQGQNYAYLAAHGSVRVYALGALPMQGKNEEMFGLELPKKKNAGGSGAAEEKSAAAQ